MARDESDKNNYVRRGRKGKTIPFEREKIVLNAPEAFVLCSCP